MRVRRRGFIAVLGGAAAWPLAGHAQQPERLRRIGVLSSFAENDPAVRESMTAFAPTLQSLGWVEGKNLRIDYRFAAGDPTLFKTYAAELVGRRRTQFSQPACRRSQLYNSRRARYRSFSCLRTIPLGWALFRS